MTQVVRAKTPADFLATVPPIAGYSVRNSLVCVAFAGNRTCGVFRLDLPARRRTSDYRLVATAVISMLSRISRADAVATIVYTDETFEAELGIPWLDFGRTLAGRIEAQGFRIAESLCVAGDGWAGYFEPGYPRDGHPLSDISSNETGALAQALTGKEIRDITEQSQLPSAGPATIAAIASLLDDPVRLRDVAAAEGNLAVTDWVELCVGQTSWSIPALAWFLELAQSPSNRDVMMLQIAFGREVGEDELENGRRLHELQRQTGLSMDDTVLAEIEAGRASLGDFSALRIMGQTTVRPHVDRVRTGIALLRTLIPAAAVDDRPALLCMLAWLSWSLGRGSAAGAFVRDALQIDPEYGMALVMYTLFGTGMLPEWAYTMEEVELQN